MGDMIATIIGTGASTTATTTYIHTDHLGGTAATTNVEGDVVELSDYHPYGSPRIALNYTGTPEQRKYIGEVYDESSGLNYLNSRYLQSSRGQFLSQDPTFLAVGSPKLTEIVNRVNFGKDSRFGRGQQMNDRQALQRFLSDPQLMNSYSYARGNPIISKDPTGEVIPFAGILLIYGLAQVGVSSWDAYNMNIEYADVTTYEQKRDSAFKAGFDILTGGVGFVGATAKVGMKGLSLALGTFQATGDVHDFFYGPQIYQNINMRTAQSTPASSRQQFVQNYNSSFGLSVGGASGGGGTPSNSSLWVTPSGAIVTFGGQLFAPPPTNNQK